MTLIEFSLVIPFLKLMTIPDLAKNEANYVFLRNNSSSLEQIEARTDLSRRIVRPPAHRSGCYKRENGHKAWMADEMSHQISTYMNSIG